MGNRGGGEDAGERERFSSWHWSWLCFHTVPVSQRVAREAKQCLANDFMPLLCCACVVKVMHYGSKMIIQTKGRQI